MAEPTKRKGYQLTQIGHLGIYLLCSGPDANGPIPGDRLIIVIYDKDNHIVRRLEQVKGDCLDEGYVDFFNSFHCRPSVHEYHIVDTDKDGNKQILATHTRPSEASSWLQANVPKWIEQHRIPQNDDNFLGGISNPVE